MIAHMKWLLLVFVAALIASCTGEPIGSYDWCYRFDFTINTQGANLTAGTHVEGFGLLTDDENILSLSYSHPRTVQPALVRVRAARAAVGNIDVLANAIIFGVGVSFQETMFSFLDEVVLDFAPAGSTDQGSSFNITVQASDQLLLESIDILGRFANPFPTSNCETFESTPTPPTTLDPSLTPSITATPDPSITPSITPTFTDTFTPSPTFTPTQTYTPSPTGTPPPYEWECYYDFLETDGGLTTGNSPYQQGEWEEGVGWKAVNGVYFSTQYTYVNVSRNLYAPGVSIVYARLDFEREYGNITGEPDFFGYKEETNYYIFAGMGTTSSPIIWEGDSYTKRVEFSINSSAVGFGGFVNVTRFTLRGGVAGEDTYLESVGMECVPYGTPTPTATATLGEGITPSPTTTASRTPLSTPTPRNTLALRTPVVVQTRTPRGTQTATITSTATVTVASTSTRTPIPPPTLVPTGIPGDPDPDGDEDAGEVNILNAINSFFNFVWNSALNFTDFIGALLGFLFGTIGNFIALIGNVLAVIGAVIALVFQVILDIATIFGLIAAIVLHMLAIFGDYLTQFFDLVFDLINNFFDATPTPIPYLPQCVTNPAASDVCAVYYIMQYTVLSGSVGSLIIPILLVLIDLTTILLFINQIRNLLRKGESVT